MRSAGFAPGAALPSPVEAYFEVANRCNSKCATCPLTFSPQEQARQLSLAEFEALVAQLPDLRRAVGEQLRATVLKGRQNYLCFQRWQALRRRGDVGALLEVASCASSIRRVG